MSICPLLICSRAEVYRNFLVVACAATGSVLIGSFLSFGWVLCIADTTIGGLRNVVIGLLQFLSFQCIISGLIVFPFTLTVGFTLLLLARNESRAVRAVFCGIVGILQAGLVALAIVAVPMWWPMSLLYCGFYGGTLGVLLSVFDRWYD
jgi:hypothetical protein